MPEFDYNAMYAKAESLLDKFGKEGTLTKTTFVVPDLNKPWERTPTNTDHAVKMVITPWSPADVSRYFGEDIIKSTTKAIILWNDAAEPIADDKIVYDSRNWIVAASKPINPAGTGIVHICALSGVVT